MPRGSSQSSRPGWLELKSALPPVCAVRSQVWVLQRGERFCGTLRSRSPHSVLQRLLLLRIGHEPAVLIPAARRPRPSRRQIPAHAAINRRTSYTNIYAISLRCSAYHAFN